MPSLSPNLLSTPPAQQSGKSTAPNSKPEDTPEQAFGAVLARQLGAPAEEAASGRSKKPLLESLAQDVAPGADPAKASQDPAANMIAILQAPVEIRALPGLAQQEVVGASLQGVAVDRKGNKTAPLTLAEQLAAEKVPGVSRTTAKTAAIQTTDKVHSSTQMIAATDERLAKLSEVRAHVSPAIMATAPRAQDVAAFNATALSHVLPTAPAAASAPVAVTTPMGSSAWAGDFAQQVTWMATGKQEQTASLHLNPPNLGPLEVVVKISDSQATVLFTSPHGAVREAIENAMPKLRELMADNGITLGNTSVSDQSPRERGDTNDNGAARRTVWETGDSLSMDASVRASTMPSTTVRHRGMVDTFA